MPGTALLTMLIPATGAEHSGSDITSQSLEFFIRKKKKSIDLTDMF